MGRSSGMRAISFKNLIGLPTGVKTFVYSQIRLPVLSHGFASHRVLRTFTPLKIKIFSGLGIFYFSLSR